MRPEGTVLFDDSLTTHPVVEDAKRRQEQRQRQNQERAERRANQPLLNRDRYPEKYAQWLKWFPTGHGKQPKCWMCREATIFWDEPAHVCDGFKPMYVERSPEEWAEREQARRERQRERWKARREAIREAKANGTFYDEGNEDEPEEDYCEGDDDGYECEDDGDPMYD
jgi:hypothetical protein